MAVRRGAKQNSSWVRDILRAFRQEDSGVLRFTPRYSPLRDTLQAAVKEVVGRPRGAEASSEARNVEISADNTNRKQKRK